MSPPLGHSFQVASFCKFSSPPPSRCHQYPGLGSRDFVLDRVTWFASLVDLMQAMQPSKMQLAAAMRRFSKLKLLGVGGNLPGPQEAKKGLQLAATRRRRRCSRPKPQWRPLKPSRRNKKQRRGWNFWQPAGHARSRGCVERCGNLRGAPKAKTRQQLVATTSRCLKPKLQWRPPKARTKAISGHSRRAGSP